MATGKEYAVVLAIRAADYATGTIRSVVGRLAAMRGQVAAMGRDLGINRVIDGLSGVRSAAAGITGTIAGGLKSAFAMTGLGAATTAAGLWKLTVSAARNGDALYQLSQRLGISGQSIKEWRYVAKQTGVDADTLTGSMSFLTRSIGQAVNGTGKGKEVFAALGIKLRDASGHVKATDVVMMELADKMAMIPDAAQRAAVASALLGKEAGMTLVPLLSQGSAKIEALRGEVRSFGITSDQSLAAAHAFAMSLNKLEGAASGLGTALGNKLYPQFQPLVDNASSWLVAARPKLTKAIGDLVARVTGGVKSINFDYASDRVLAFANTVQSCVEAIGGWTTVLAGAALMMVSGPIMSTIHLIAAISQLGIALGVVAVKFALAFGGGIVAMISSFVLALRSGIGVVQALNIAMAANPVGAIILAIATLVGLGVTLYNTWEPFRKMIDGIVDKVTSLGKGAIGWIGKQLGFSPGGEVPKPAVPSAPGGSAPAAIADAPATGPRSVDQAAPPARGDVAIPPPVMLQSKADLTVRILSEAPAKVEGVKQQGAGLTVRTDLATGKGTAGTG
ncbi:hypothetical protein [Magnetospirillum fulvum]|uniref:Tail length phage protein n=1 Tax=Magnetospirillum fulvum MGU-K5 TaxID=1316936 RepID=S9S9K2_MAGFU|nr:hypothetical protein [Magnetospirillum fulvum]EPY01379.1 tail length phage protein [Magnetospirillum fulvum MGU-K5]